MSRNVVIVGNWKMNKTPEQAKAFMGEVQTLIESKKALIPANFKYGVGVPAVDLCVVREASKSLKDFIIAAQNVHENVNGAFTGELSIEMIKAAGANAVIIGHSERRAMFNETNETVNKKTKAALANGILPIVCVGETLEEYETGMTKKVVETQIKASLAGITDWKNVVIAYEPIWAIGTGKTATAKDAQDICKFIRSITSHDVVIQYGGSVKPDNIVEILEQEDIDGALVGGASLDPKSFVALLTGNK